MNLTDLLTEQHIISHLTCRDKESVLRELVSVLVDPKTNVTEEVMFNVLTERERLGSTGIGNGVAIPHGKVKGIDRLLVSFGRSAQGVDFDSLDGKPANLFFVLLAPENSTGVHLKLLAKISKMLKEKEFRTGLMRASSGEDIFKLIKNRDREL
ncbi:MAG: PTS sugar transporter subunit IIA [Deltaproteobacteria bacterium]|nr:PTS sugar transporter subunit IIA [Deltaproteobacteria bacterium]